MSTARVSVARCLCRLLLLGAVLGLSLTLAPARLAHAAGVTTVLAWGDNLNGELGNGSTTNSASPVPVTAGLPAGDPVIAVAAGSLHSLALTQSGAIHAWGFNDAGQLGTGTSTDAPTPTAVIGLPVGDPVRSIAAGRYHSLALTQSGKVYAWGLNYTGQLGIGGADDEPHPVPALVTGLPANDPVVAIAAGASFVTYAPNLFDGADFSLAVTLSGKVYAWGWNAFGQLGNPSVPSGGACLTNVLQPDPQCLSGVAVPVEGLPASDPVVDVSAGPSYSLAVTRSGAVYAWGDNEEGELGIGDTLPATPCLPGVNWTGAMDVLPSGCFAATPAQLTSGLPAGDPVIAISAGEGNSMALTQSGAVFGWGVNNLGQLGIGSNSNDSTWTPQQVLTGSGGLPLDDPVVAIAAGTEDSLALTAAGNLYAWGDNGSGQLGLGAADAYPHDTPALVAQNVSAISASNYGSPRGFTLAITIPDPGPAPGPPCDPSSCTGGTAAPPTADLAPNNQALWVWNSAPLLGANATARTELVARGAASGVTALYVSVYASNDSHFYPPAYVEDLVAKAHARGIRVYAAYGDPSWATPDACVTGSFEHERMADVASYNEAYASYPSAQLDGVALDVEPNPMDPDTLVSLYRCLQGDLRAYGLKMVVALQFGWVDNALGLEQVLAPTLALNPDTVVVDGYWDGAGSIDSGSGTCLTYGILCRDWPAVAQANSTGQGTLMLAGLETADCDAGGNPNCAGEPAISFYDDGQAAMDTTAQTVAATIGTSSSAFGGFAVDTYTSAYLGGQTTPDWPAVNPDLLAGGALAGTIYNNTTTLLQEPAGSASTLQSVSFPAGAVSGPATLSVVPSTSAPATGRLQALGQTFTFTVSDSNANIISTFSQPVTLTFGFRGSDLPAGVSPSSVVVASYDPASGTFSPVATTITGSDPYVATATVSHFSGYGLAFPAPAPLTITPDNQTMTYGGTVPAFTVSPSGYSGLVNGDTPSVVSGLTCGAVDSNGNPVSSTTPASTYAISCSGGIAANYSISYQLGTLTINKAPLTVAADNKTMTLHGTVPALTATLSGFKNGETLATSGVTGSADCTTTATSSSPAGSYPITCAAGTLSAGNYSFGPFVAGTLTIQYASSGTCDGDVGHAILQPINPDGSSVFKQGSTVPAKFRVCDANGVSIGTPGLVTSFLLVKTSADPNTTINETVVSTTPDTAFRWDATDQQWIFNISTTSLASGTRYYYAIALNDGMTINFSFALK